MPFDCTPERPSDPELALLMAARNKIGTSRNWIRGCMQDGDRFCSIGAIDAASKEMSLGWLYKRRVIRRVAREIPLHSYVCFPCMAREVTGFNLFARNHVIGYNDGKKRTHTEVYDVFTDAINRREWELEWDYRAATRAESFHAI